VADVAVTAHLRHMELSGCQPRTVHGRGLALARMAAVLPAPLLGACAADLLSWRAGLTVSGDSVATYVSHARAFYGWALDAGLIDENPAARLPAPRRGRRLPRPVSEKHLFAAVAGAPDRIRPWLVLAAWCGLRAKEIALLRRECVLEQAATPVLLIAWDATKGRLERAVPLCPFALEELRPHLPRTGWVFRRRDGQGGPNRPRHVSNLAAGYLRDAGIPATLHMLRHRFGTEAYRAARDLRLVQELLGHRDPATTAGYAAIVQADAIRVVGQLPVPGRLRAVTG
jgi:integrase/recombinase XerC